MRIVYIGAVDFSYHCLDTVLKKGGNVVGVVTTSKAKHYSDYRDLSPLAKRHDIPLHYFTNINEVETVEWVRRRSPDITFCWGISQLIKPELLSVAPMGILGAHPTLLPQNRGRHPLIWTLVLGLKETGLTFFFMDEGADSGPILSQRRATIGRSDDASSLYNKIKKSADIQISEFLPKLESGNYSTVRQNETLANYWRKRCQKDGLIDWRMSSKAILALIKALTKPYPGAEFSYRGQNITAWAAEHFGESAPMNLESGRIIMVQDNCPTIKCYDGAVTITKHHPQTEFIKGDCLD